MERVLFMAALIAFSVHSSAAVFGIKKQQFIKACKEILQRSENDCRGDLWKTFHKPKGGKHQDFFDNVGFETLYDSEEIQKKLQKISLFWTHCDCDKIDDIVTELGNRDDRLVHSQNLAPAVFIKSDTIRGNIGKHNYHKILRQFSQWMAKSSKRMVLWLTPCHPSFFPGPHQMQPSTWETHEVALLPQDVNNVVVLHMPCYSSSEELDAIAQAGRCTNAESIARLLAVNNLPQHLTNKFICCQLPPYERKTNAGDIAKSIIDTVKSILDAALSSKCPIECLYSSKLHILSTCRI